MCEIILSLIKVIVFLVFWKSPKVSNLELVLDERDQNPKTQPSTFNIVALRIFWKIYIFEENRKKVKIRFLEIKLFTQKEVRQN